MLKTALERKNKLVLSFPYDKFIVQALSPIKRKEYKPAKKEWVISLCQDNLEEVLDFLKDQEFEIQESALILIDSVKQLSIQQDKNLLLSQAQDSDFQVFELKGELRSFQRAGIEYAVINKRVLIGDEQGLGKTIEAIGVTQSTHELPVLVICINTLIPNWVREFQSWVNFDVKPVYFDSEFPEQFEVIVMNYNNTKKFLEKLITIPWRTIIIDESHLLKSTQAQRTKCVTKIVNKTDPPYIMELTGTSSPNKPSELIPQLSLLGVLDRDFGGWMNFVTRYCGAFRDRFGWNISGSSNLEELHERMRRSCYIRRSKKDVLKELPDKQYQLLEINLSNKKKYKEAEQDFLTYIEKLAHQDVEKKKDLKGLSEEEKKKIKKRHIINILRTVEKAEQLVKLGHLRRLSIEGKVDDIIEWVESFLESGEKLVLFGVHTNVINLISEYFQCNKITGDVKVEERQKTVDDFQTNPDTKLIVLNYEAGGVGITLTASSHVGLLEPPWTPSSLSQGVDRLHRIGQKNCVNVYRFVAKDSIDEWVYELLQIKQVITSQVNEGEQILLF